GMPRLPDTPLPPCDLLIRNAHLVEANQPSRRASVGVRDGSIVGVWGDVPDAALGSATRIVDAEGRYLMPGLINAHTHLFQTLLRGLGDDLPGSAWFQQMLLPAAGALDVADAEVAAAIGCAEALLGGTTTVLDFMQIHGQPGMAEAVIRGMRSVGVRAGYG